MAAGDIYKLAVIGAANYGQTMVCTFHYRQEALEINPTPSEDLIMAWQQDLETAWLSTFSSTATLQRLSVRGVTTPTEGFDYSYTAPLPSGVFTGDPLPPQVTPVVTWTTGLIGRRYRGRSYTWQIAEANNDGGIPDANLVANLGAFAAAAMLIGGAPTSAEWRMVVYSKVGVLSTPVTSYIVRNRLYTQRRRVLGSGS